jgi:hypothetical protein
MSFTAALGRRGRFLLAGLVVALLAVLAGFLWASDKIAAQGERTIYTAGSIGRYGGRVIGEGRGPEHEERKECFENRREATQR